MEQQYRTPRQKQQEEKDALKARVLYMKLNNMLPRDWKDRIYFMAPEYNTGRGSTTLRNVYAMQTVDKDIVEMMEQVARDWEEERASS